jgi:hypothetical protein
VRGVETPLSKKKWNMFTIHAHSIVRSKGLLLDNTSKYVPMYLRTKHINILITYYNIIKESSIKI